MTTGRTVFFTFLLGALIVGAILGAREWRARNEVSTTAPVPASHPIRDTLPDFAFPNLQGDLQRSNKWVGRVLVLNFWATWCPSCRQEIPVFMALQEELSSKGLQFVGIAIDEKSKVQDFVDTLGVNYPILLGENDAIQMSRDLGNRLRGLPFTVIFDRTGRVAYAHAGELRRPELEAKIRPLL